MLQLPPDSVSGGFAGGFDVIGGLGGHRQLTTVSWLYTGQGDNFFGPAGLWFEGVSGSDQFFVTLCIAAAGDPGVEPCVFAQLKVNDGGGVINMQYQTPVNSIVVPHRYCLAGTADLDAQDVHLYLGDEVTPMAELTSWAAGYPKNFNSGTTTTSIGQKAIIDEADGGFGQAYDKCLAMGRIMSLAELRDWQFAPRNLAGCLLYSDPHSQWPVPVAGAGPFGGGNYKSSEGRAIEIDSDFGAPQPTNWGFFPDANYHRIQAGA